MAEVTFGLDKSTGTIKHVSEVESGLRCNCICLECNKELKSAKGEVQEHHFKHHEPSNCNASFESVLHLTAKKILSSNRSFNSGSKGVVPYLQAELEKVDGLYRYDVYLSTVDRPIVVEIVVTCEVEKTKRNYIRSIKQRAIAIDLKNIDRDINYSDLERIILHETSCKEILWWDGVPIELKIYNKVSKPSNSSSQQYWLLLLLLLFKPIRQAIFRFIRSLHS